MQVELKYKGQTAIVETKGGELVSYRDANGVEYIWNGDERYWSGRNPLLFPVVGAVPDNKIEVGGISYPMPKHGFARWHEFSLITQEESWCELELCSDAETLQQYPFAFSLRVRQALENEGFTTTISVYNPGKAELPFCVGAHPAFHCPLRAGERYEDYILKFDACESPPIWWSTLSEDSRSRLTEEGVFTPEHRMFDRLDAVIFEGLKSHRVSLVNRKTGRGLQLNFSDFPVLAFWSMPHKNAPFLCIEPWHGYPGVVGEQRELREKRHCILLAPGETRRLHYSVMTI